MIKILDARMLDGLPHIVASMPGVQSLSYALDRILETELFARMGKTQVYANIDQATDDVLDVLAVELQVPSYRQEYDLKTKRELVKGAMPYWVTAGSAKCVEDLCKTIFGDAEVLEWFTYGADAGMYKVRTTNPAINAGDVDSFKAAAESVKRLSQHLERIDLELTTNEDIFFGGFVRTGTTVMVETEVNK